MKTKTIPLIAVFIVFFLWTPFLMAAQHRHGDHHQSPADVKVHTGLGTVHSVDLDSATVRMAHEPIASLRWPRMVMDLKAKDSAMLKGLEEGDRVEFDLVQTEKGFFITRIQKIR